MRLRLRFSVAAAALACAAVMLAASGCSCGKKAANTAEYDALVAAARRGDKGADAAAPANAAPVAAPSNPQDKLTVAGARGPTLDRLFVMSHQEAVERLNGFAYAATVRHGAAFPTRTVDGIEKQTLVTRGDGATHLRIETGDASFTEIVYKDGTVYTRNSGATWRRSLPQGEVPFYREKVFSSLSRLYRYLRGFVEWAETGRETYEGREVIRFVPRVLVGGEAAADDLKLAFGAVRNVYLLNLSETDRSINATRKRIAGVKKAEGFVLVDADTGVPLRASVDAQWEVPFERKAAPEDAPGTPTSGTMTVSLSLDGAATRIGDGGEVAAPLGDIAAERRRTDGDPLKFLEDGDDKSVRNRAEQAVPPPSFTGTAPPKPAEKPAERTDTGER